MNKIMDTIVFGRYTVQDLLIIAGVTVVFLILLVILKKVFMKKERGQHFQFVDCINCGWHGKVSRHAGRCPKCNEPLGEQRIKRKKLKR